MSNKQYPHCVGGDGWRTEKGRDARYNVVSTRLSEAELEQLDKLRAGKSRSDAIRLLLKSSGSTEPVC